MGQPHPCHAGPDGAPCRNVVACPFCRRYATDRRFNLLWGGDGNVPELPGIVRRAVNYAASTVRHVAAGLPQASPEEQGRRRAICASCPSGMFDGERCRHPKCGCTAVAKSARMLERCPLDHWS
jgi:hypothetical protein